MCPSFPIRRSLASILSVKPSRTSNVRSLEVILMNRISVSAGTPGFRMDRPWTASIVWRKSPRDWLVASFSIQRLGLQREWTPANASDSSS